MKKPSERSDSETKQLETMSVPTEGVPKEVLTEIARDKDFKKWDSERQSLTINGLKNKKEVGGPKPKFLGT